MRGWLHKTRRAIPAIGFGLLAAAVFLADRGADRDGHATGPGDATAEGAPERGPVTGGAGAAAEGAEEHRQAFEDFEQWIAEGAAGDSLSGSAARARIAEGRRLAAARREAMLALIERDPERALQLALPLHEYAALPAEVAALVEEPFSETATVRALPVCGDGRAALARGGGATMTHEAKFEEGGVYRSFVFGRRQAIGTKEGIPLQGIRLEGVAALRADVLHLLGAAEVSAAREIYPLANPDGDRCFATGTFLDGNAVTALGGGRRFRFRDAETLRAFDERIGDLDELPGPHAGSQVLAAPFPAGGAAAGFDLEGAESTAFALASAWTETPKDVLYIRVDFSDVPGEPVTQAILEGIVNTTVSQSIADMSYGKTSINATATSTVLPMPQTAAWYATDTGGGTARNDDLLNDAQTAATGAGYDMGDYDIIAVFFADIGMTSNGVDYGGLAGGGDQWIQGSTSAELITHEFGHNYGLGHASFWDTGGASVVGAGANDEYGDVFDIMGDGPLPQGHFNVQGKALLNWLESTEWTDATAGGSGTYRIHRFDDPDTTEANRGLRVTKAVSPSEYYWVGFRQNFPANETLDCGAYVVWERPGFDRSWLIDTTPGSAGGREDGGISLGRTYSDTVADVHITPVAKGGEDPDEWLELVVNLGPFPGNGAPTAAISGPAVTDARTWNVFSVSASDGDGDDLAYAWDFGDGAVSVNQGAVSHSWKVGGTYTVEVTVSDMKGGVMSDSMMVTVNDPLGTWMQRTSGVTGDLNDIAANGTVAVAVGENFSIFTGDSLTSSDGVTWSSGTFSSNEHMNGVAWTGSEFLAVGQKYNFGISDWEGSIVTSAAGTGWTQRYQGAVELLDVASSGIVHVAVGEDGLILRSTDLTTWSPIAPPAAYATYDLTSIAHGNGGFVIVGRADRFASGDTVVLTSSGGLTWSAADLATLDYPESWQDFTAIDFAGDRFLASGWYSQIGSSEDGALWSTTLDNSVGAMPTYSMIGFASGNGVYLAVGQDVADGDADINALSGDGATWTESAVAAQADRNGVAFFKDTFITVGDDGSIRQSGTAASPSPYLNWQHTTFPGLPPGSGALENYDGDTLTNLSEYGLRRSAMSAAGADGPAAAPDWVTDSTNPLLAGRLVLRVDMPEEARPDVTYRVVVTEDFVGETVLATKAGTGPWTWLGGGTARIVEGTPAGGRVIVEVGDNALIAAEDIRMMVLEVELAP